MIKVNKIQLEGIKDGKNVIKADLIADTSLEVEDIGTRCESIVGLSENDELAMGSTCFTTQMEFGMLDSTGNWRFQ